MTDSIYHKLRKFQDSFPIGFPETDSGVELEILKRLYTPEEAEIALNLSAKPETAEAIADRIGRSCEEMEAKLESMAKRGLVFRGTIKGSVRYNAVPFMIGLYEYSIDKVDRELAALFSQYYEEAYQGEMGRSNVPVFKVIPIQKHLSHDLTLYPYHKIEEDIRSARVIAVTDCICRTEARLLGKGCDKPLETCLSFGAAAEFYIHTGRGREITAEEAVRILKNADDAGLVHAGINAQHLSNICNCCPCCCASMKGIVEKGHDKHKYLNALFEPVVDEELCVSCEVCLDRCPVGAISIEDAAVVDRSLCIGCGLCASGCPSEAINMTLREDREEPFRNAREVYSEILKRKQQA